VMSASTNRASPARTFMVELKLPRFDGRVEA